jgi:hypothetical protein
MGGGDCGVYGNLACTVGQPAHKKNVFKKMRRVAAYIYCMREWQADKQFVAISFIKPMSGIISYG